MNLIPKINGNYEILSSVKKDLNGVIIEDRNDMLTSDEKNFIYSKLGVDKTKLVLIESAEDIYSIDLIGGKIYIETPKELKHSALSTLYNIKDDLYVDMRLTDYPKYNHREFSVDVARNFFCLDELKKIINEAANLKINKIHLHLCDNQGWRVESKKFSLLNDIGGKKGYYTQTELKELVNFCNLRGIELIPEIDIPGHVGALIASYPNLSCDKKSVELDNGYCRNDKTLCLGSVDTYKFIVELLDEIMDIFPSKYFHIGCDELDLSHNKKCLCCKEYMKKNNLSLNELVSDFVNRISNYLMENNKEVIIWNDATKYGKLNERIIVQNWFDYPFDNSTLKEINNRNFIVGSTFDTYFDYPMSLISLKTVYKFVPQIKNKVVDQDTLLGISSSVWTEVISDKKELEKHIFPRLVAFSENAWTKDLDYEEFLSRLNLYLKNYDKKGISYNKDYLNNKNINEIVYFFKKFLENNDDSISLYQTLIGSKLILSLLKKSNHIKDIPEIMIKMLKN